MCTSCSTRCSPRAGRSAALLAPHPLLSAYYKFLDEQLSDRSHIAGDTYSIADIVALCTIDFAASLNKLPVEPSLERLTRWHESVSARPSAKA